MGRVLREATFLDWVRHVFDHPGNGPEWYFGDDADEWDAEPALTVNYISRLFSEPETPLATYSDEQLNRGFWYLISNSCSDHMYALVSEAVPLHERLACLESFVTLFQRLFAARCSPHLGHLGEPDTGVLNSACYMWWDILPLHGEPEDPDRAEFDAKCLEVMEKTLGLPSIPVQESALHGLGHWHCYYPSEVEMIISKFLARSVDLRRELQAYAENAMVGYVQ